MWGWLAARMLMLAPAAARGVSAFFSVTAIGSFISGIISWLAAYFTKRVVNGLAIISGFMAATGAMYLAVDTIINSVKELALYYMPQVQTDLLASILPTCTSNCILLIVGMHLSLTVYGFALRSLNYLAMVA